MSEFFVQGGPQSVAGQQLAVTTNNLKVINTADAAAIDIDQQTAGRAIVKITATEAATVNASVSTLTTAGAIVGFEQVDLNGVKAWRALYANPS